MDRTAKMTAGLDIANQVGLEIGPLCFPIVSRDQGKIYYADFDSTEGLRAKYADNKAIDVDRIVEVDYATGGRSLLETIGKPAQFDYVLASHVIEHVADPIGFLQDLTGLLKVGGQLRLAVPDKRFTFDYHRPVSEVSELVEARLLGRTTPSPKQVYCYFSQADSTMTIEAGWSGSKLPPMALERVRLEDALKKATSVAAGGYFDVHSWVYTPQSFVNILRQCFLLGLLELKVTQFWDTPFQLHEFTLALERIAPDDDRDATLKEQLASLPVIADPENRDRIELVPPVDFTLVAAESGAFGGKVYVVWQGQRYWVSAVEWALEAGYRWPDDICWISDDELGRIPPAAGWSADLANQLRAQAGSRRGRSEKERRR